LKSSEKKYKYFGEMIACGQREKLDWRRTSQLYRRQVKKIRHQLVKARVEEDTSSKELRRLEKIIDLKAFGTYPDNIRVLCEDWNLSVPAWWIKKYAPFIQEVLYAEEYPQERKKRILRWIYQDDP
jgi:hypothetical protein